MLFNIAEKAWLEAPIYNRAMDNYQTFLARKQQKAGGDATPNPSQIKIQESIKKYPNPGKLHFWDFQKTDYFLKFRLKSD